MTGVLQNMKKEDTSFGTVMLNAQLQEQYTFELKSYYLHSRFAIFKVVNFKLDFKIKFIQFVLMKVNGL